jgi:hypothetical protein
MARNRATPRDQLPTLGSIAASGIGLTLWCDDDVCSYRREHGYRYQITYTTENLAAFAEAYGSGEIFIDWIKRLRCSVCGSAQAKFVLSGHKTPAERWREED